MFFKNVFENIKLNNKIKLMYFLFNNEIISKMNGFLELNKSKQKG